MPAVQGHGDRAEQQCKVYAMNTDEVVHDATVRSCILLLDSVPIIVLFDSGSAHSFIC